MFKVFSALNCFILGQLLKKNEKLKKRFRNLNRQLH